MASASPDSSSPPTSSKTSQSSKSSGNTSKQSYPLYPSVAQLLHEKGVSTSEADKIPATGPKGRLLKGDVLAYLGNISASYSSDQSTRISKLAHLDLSSIQIASPRKPDPTSSNTALPAKTPAPEQETEVAVTISLKAVLEVQSRVQSALGLTLPLSTFISRATKVANQRLPPASPYTASADEIFDEILGLNTAQHKASHRSFTPQMVALPAGPSPGSIPSSRVRQPDIIDELTIARPSSKASSVKSHQPTPKLMTSPKDDTSMTVFRVSAKKGEEKRAKVFLERVKTILQVEPGTLVL